MSGGKHCYPNSDILINKYNIYDKELLEKLEIQKVATKLLGLDIYPQRIGTTLDIEHLISLHKYLLEIYMNGQVNFVMKTSIKVKEFCLEVQQNMQIMKI